MKRTVQSVGLTAMWTFMLLVVNLSVVYAKPTTFAFVPTQDNHTVTIINTENDTVIDRYRNISKYKSGPFGVAISPTHQNVFVTHPAYRPTIGEPDKITVLQPKARKTAPSTVNVGNGAYGIAVSPSGWAVYEANAGSGSVTVLSSAGNVKKVLDLNLKWPMGVVVARKQGKDVLYVTENQGESVAVVDPVYGRLLERIRVGKSPIGLVLSKDAETLYVANYGDGSISVVDLKHRKESKKVVTIGKPYGMAISPDGQKVLATIQQSDKSNRQVRGFVGFLDTKNFSEEYVKVGREPIGVSAVGKVGGGYKVYVANYGSRSLSVLTASDSKAKLMKNVRLSGRPAAFGSFVADFSSASSGKDNNFSDEEQGFIMSFLGDALYDYAGSELIALIGLPDSSGDEGISQVLTELQAISSQLDNIQKELTTLLSGLNTILAELSAAQTNQLNDYLTATTSNWSQFQNAFIITNPAPTESAYMDLNDLVDGSVQSNAAIQALQNYYNDNSLSNLVTNANIISGYQGNLTVTTVLTDMANALSSSASNDIASKINIMNVGSWTPPGQSQPVSLSVFDYYDNGLMNQYFSAVTSLQQMYTIESTLIYLQAYGPSTFDNFLLAEDGIGLTSPQSYSANMATLQMIYTSRLDSLQSGYANSFVSDAGGSSPNLPMKTGKMVTLPGNWNDLTNLFIWQGLLPPNVSGYAGTWDGNNLTVQFDYDNYSLNNISDYCILPPTSFPVIDFWYQPGWVGQLQCANSLVLPGDGGWGLGGINTEYWPSVDDPFTFNFGGPNGSSSQWQFIGQYSRYNFAFSPRSGSGFSINNPSYLISTPDFADFYLGPYANSWFYGYMTTQLTNGYRGAFTFGGIGTANGVNMGWNMSLACSAEVPSEYRIPQSSNCYYPSSGGICLGGNLITIAGPNDGNYGNISFSGTCPAPSNPNPPNLLN